MTATWHAALSPTRLSLFVSRARDIEGASRKAFSESLQPLPTSMEGGTSINASEYALHKKYRITFEKLEERVNISVTATNSVAALCSSYIRILQIRNHRHANDNISRQLYTLNNRTLNIAEKIGFPTFDGLESAVLANPDIWNVDAIQEAHRLTAKTKKRPEELQATLNRDFSSDLGLREELDRLRHESAGNGHYAEDFDLRLQLNALSLKYDALLNAKENAEKKYKEDYMKWKSFKSWLFTKSKHGQALRAQFDDEFGVEDFTVEGAMKSKKHNLLVSLDHVDATTLTAEQGLTSTLREPKHAKRRDENGETLKENKHDRLDVFTQMPRTPEMLTPDPCQLMRRSANWTSSSSPIAKQRINQDANESGFTQGSSNQHNSSAGEVRADGVMPLGTSNIEVKDKGRYIGASKGDAINALFQIDTSRNHGIAYQFDEVVRGREHRRRLHAGDCDCCKEYYDRLEPLPGRLLPPAWTSPTAKPTIDNKHPMDVEQHKKYISRHRHQWAPPTTPPDYWNIGFPTTQEAADINRRAGNIHVDKRRRVELEAKLFVELIMIP
ncbi:DNA repair protein endonuclease SAE2/CtIP C-terminus-domain-containing protein [Phellopilus nigrolimitatus]|nr:DNA repair protein endonuclease SAE2/CtIP C-terminus-domain-containing protein [Phellopilus nigrolimitatus]